MAKAPVPGSVRREEESTTVTVITLTVKRPIVVKGRTLPETVSVAPDLIPIRERTICRKATGLPISAYWAGEDAIDLDSVVVLWWLGRRLAGESTLTWDRALKQWPLDLGLDELEIHADGPDDDDDEDDDDEEDGDDADDGGDESPEG